MERDWGHVELLELFSAPRACYAVFKARADVGVGPHAKIVLVNRNHF